MNLPSNIEPKNAFRVYAERQVTFITIRTQKVRGYLDNIWVKIGLVVVFFYVITHKDLSFSVNMSDAGVRAENIRAHQSDGGVAASKKHAPIAAAAIGSAGDISDESATDAAAIAGFMGMKASTYKNEKGVKTTSVGNTMSNLTPVLSPNYAVKKGISKAFVDEKLAICNDYVKNYHAAAVAEMHLYGIPASITLAQGLLESNAGDSRLATTARNHFGIKCFSRTCQKGHCMNASDDTHKDFFRIYPSAVECYRAHSVFLQADRYKWLRKFGKKDYKNWALGLKKSGYATAPHYAEALIKIVEFLNLQRYDSL